MSIISFDQSSDAATIRTQQEVLAFILKLTRSDVVSAEEKVALIRGCLVSDD